MTLADCQRYSGHLVVLTTLLRGAGALYPTCQERLLSRGTAKPQQGQTGIHVGLTPSPMWVPQSSQMELGPFCWLALSSASSHGLWGAEQRPHLPRGGGQRWLGEPGEGAVREAILLPNHLPRSPFAREPDREEEPGTRGGCRLLWYVGGLPSRRGVQCCTFKL